MDIETKLDMLAMAARQCAFASEERTLRRYRNDILKELRRLYRCEKKLQEVAAL